MSECGSETQCVSDSVLQWMRVCVYDSVMMKMVEMTMTMKPGKIKDDDLRCRDHHKHRKNQQSINQGEER